MLNHPTPPIAEFPHALPCGAHHLWDEQQLRATLELAALVGWCPPGPWSLLEAVIRPLTALELKPTMDRMRDLREATSVDYELTYLSRLGVLGSDISQFPTRWARETRYGAAWMLMMSGILTHRFTDLDPTISRLFWSPPHDFFTVNNTAEKLTGLLELAFQPGPRPTKIAALMPMTPRHVKGSATHGPDAVEGGSTDDTAVCDLIVIDGGAVGYL